MRIPKLYKHKSGKGRVRINGRDFYTPAQWGQEDDPSMNCYEGYVDILRKHCQGCMDASIIMVATLMRSFMEDAETAYRSPGWWPGSSSEDRCQSKD